jgi:pimeloyl-ACP methyl ester carboxylesterase
MGHDEAAMSTKTDAPGNGEGVIHADAPGNGEGVIHADAPGQGEGAIHADAPGQGTKATPRGLSFDETGRGPLVVMLHSGGMSSRQWRRAAERLAPSYRVVSPDFLGYGASGVWPEGERFELAQEIAATEALLQRLGEPAHLVGHSYGGLMALRVALAAPGLVRSLALYEPVAFGVLDAWADAEALDDLGRDRAGVGSPDGAEALEGFLHRFVDYWGGPGGWGALRPATRDDFRRVGWKLYQEVQALLRDRTGKESYSSLTVPTLLLSGEHSPPDAKRVVEVLAGAIPGAKLEVLPSAGHMGPLTHADAFLERLAAHLSSASEAERGA